MHTPIRPLTYGLAAILLLTLTPAARAYNATGSWGGTYACKGTEAGAKTSYKQTIQVTITHDQANQVIGAVVDFLPPAFNYAGLALADPPKPDKGDLMLVLCGTDDDLTIGDFKEMVHLTVKTNPTKGTGSMTGTGVYSRASDAQAYTCKWKLKRTSTQDPAVPTACP